MTAPAVYDFPVEWYQFIVSQTFPVRSMNQSSGKTWGNSGQSISGPTSQAFMSDITFATLADHMKPELGPVLQDMDAFWARMRGRKNVVRMSWARALAPWWDRNLIPGQTLFSDGTGYTDGTGFADGYLPPEVYLASAAAAGATYLVLGGFPVSTPNVLRRGDLMQIKPNGIPGNVPHLYKAMYGGGTDAAGQIGLAIEPPLRQGVAAGDTVGLRVASTLFRMVDDSQFDVQASGVTGSLGGSLVEALDLVP